MKKSANQTLYQLIRTYMDTVGTSQTTLVALKSYIHAVRRLTCTEDQFKPLILELNGVIRDTEPKVVSLLHLIEAFESEMQPYFDADLETARTKAIEILTGKLDAFEADTKRLTEACTAAVNDGDFIIVHSPTAYIRNGLVRAHVHSNRRFKVLVLKQDFFRTKDLVNALQLHGLDYRLIPEHNLSHYLEKAKKVFISAVTVTADHKALTGPGTANVVGICHANHVPVYLFAESLKFSHTPLHEQHIHKARNQHLEGGFAFELTAFSHDFVDLAMVEHIITEKGESDMSGRPLS